MVADFFQTDVEGTSALGGGHKFSVWQKMLSESNLEVQFQKDITHLTAPTIDIADQLSKELAFPINDVAGNRTRFLLLRHGTPLQRGDVASFAFSLHANAPGSLLEALTCVARLGFNMSRIESRPSKRELGEYVFFVDVEFESSIV